MKKQNKKLTIKYVERLKNSYFGNPKYLLICEDKNGEIITGRTATNGAIGYFIGWDSEGKTLDFTYHTTRNGNIIFDYARG